MAPSQVTLSVVCPLITKRCRRSISAIRGFGPHVLTNLTSDLNLEYLRSNRLLSLMEATMKTGFRIPLLAILVILYSVLPTQAQDLGPGFTKVKEGIYVFAA